MCFQTVVICHTWLACLEEANFAAAHEFQPERWLHEGEITRISPFLVVPFGCGRRICPGKRFVEQSLYLTLAKVIIFISCLYSIYIGSFI
jgi:ecdysone 20-monooxygenase